MDLFRNRLLLHMILLEPHKENILIFFGTLMTIQFINPVRYFSGGKGNFCMFSVRFI